LKSVCHSVNLGFIDVSDFLEETDMAAKHPICYLFIATVYAILGGIVFLEYASIVHTACYMALSGTYVRLAIYG
jgi:hypothetical protein